MEPTGRGRTCGARARRGFRAGARQVPYGFCVHSGFGAAFPGTRRSGSRAQRSGGGSTPARRHRPDRSGPRAPSDHPDLRAPDAQQVLAALSDAADAGASLEAHHRRIPHSRPWPLSWRSSDPSGRRSHGRASFPPEPPLRVGMRDPRVPLIRAKLGLTLSGEQVYDRALAVRVASLQGSPALTPRRLHGADAACAAGRRAIRR